MAEDHTFPQNGDHDYAEAFGQMIGHDVLSETVVTGMGFTPNYTAPDLTIATGVVVAREDSATDPEGETRLNSSRVVQLSQDTIALTDNDVNHIYIEPNIQTDDSGSFVAYTNESNASTTAVKIGEVDTLSNSSKEINRSEGGGYEYNNEITLNLPTTRLNTSEYAALHRMVVPSGSDLEVVSVSLANNSHNIPAGLQLLIRDETSGSTVAEYSSNYNTGNPIETITGVAGNDITIAVDNGFWNSGTGSEQYANGFIKVRIV